ncbi:MAG: dihydroxyacetone kinase subunit L [Lentisphaerae bacterium RIFOXYA12_FULL_48_11]|nr:MAG: dihydroxyacetone kinase subunit L [Lentisphaerae bacterium RIFOXYA12_FULL_48_11]
MADNIGYEGIVKLLKAAAEKIKANRDYLSKLDSATGDGDHGTAVFKVADAITGTIAKDNSKNLKILLKDIGWAAMSTDAGSTSPLYGSLFMGMSESIADDALLDCKAFVSMMEAGVTKLRKNTKAEVGCKTMIDTLVPAITALRGAADSGKSIAQALSDGADAAVKGAESTKEMKATFGRAKNIGERSIGHIDPGATSMSLLFVGMKEGYQNG